MFLTGMLEKEREKMTRSGKRKKLLSGKSDPVGSSKKKVMNLSAGKGSGALASI
jgi:hypothetical protein